MATWKPSAAGRLFTNAINWQLNIAGEQFILEAGDLKLHGSLERLKDFNIAPGHFWATIQLPLPDHPKITLDGLPNQTAAALKNALSIGLRRIRVAGIIQRFSDEIAPIVEWTTSTRAACKQQLASRGWLSTEFKAAIQLQKPVGLASLLSEPEVTQHLSTQPDEIRGVIGFWQKEFEQAADSINERQLVQELQTSKPFFDSVEKSPLTEEQTRAVLCFDNRVLLVASAGSGKTSTMVAKAGYALLKGYFAADRMLLLAFNNEAAAELRERIKTRLGPLGLPAEQIVAKTFHAFGLDVIGQATGKRPTLAPWLEQGRDLEILLEMVDELKDRDAQFRTYWDLFRVVLGQDLPAFGKESESPDAWDSTKGVEGFWTLNGEVVKSRGEQLIANWLFYNGVRYQYEAPYPFDTATADHRQYTPDFYFPEIDTYLEHWAVDEDGNPPAEFAGYAEGMAWKRKLHAEHGTQLLETTMASLWSGEALHYLATELTQRGVTLDPNPDRPAQGRKPIENPRLARTFRSFLTHAKSNRLTLPQLRDRLASGVLSTTIYN